MGPVGSRASGRLIAFEGCDGSGKSTQARLLYRWLVARGVRSVLTSWNSSDVVAPVIRRGKRERLLPPITYSLLHACDFAERLEHVILPRLECGYTVIADRYVFTGLARDVARGCNERWVRELYDFAPLPQLTFYCQIDALTAADRLLATRTRLKYYEAGLDVEGEGHERRRSFVRFQGRVVARYDVLASEFGFRRLDATQTVAVQQLAVREAMARLLGERDAVSEHVTQAATTGVREQH